MIGLHVILQLKMFSCINTRYCLLESNNNVIARINYDK